MKKLCYLFLLFALVSATPACESNRSDIGDAAGDPTEGAEAPGSAEEAREERGEATNRSGKEAADAYEGRGAVVQPKSTDVGTGTGSDKKEAADNGREQH